MSWLFPGFLGGLALVSLPVLLHLLRRKPKKTVLFPSLRFLNATIKRSDRAHRIRRWIVLALRCIALALLAAGFARPFFGAKSRGSTQAVVVVIDNSFSLQVQGCWPALREWAREQVGPLGPGDKLGLLLAGPRPKWLATPTADVATALATLDRLELGWESVRIDPALRLAGDALASTSADQRRIIVLCDHQKLSWLGTDFSKRLPGGVVLAFPTVPKGVTRQAALSPPSFTQTDGGIQVSLTIRNFTGPQTRTLSVYRDGDDKPVYQDARTLAEREIRRVQLTLPSPSAGSSRFRFSLDPDDLPADDTVYAVWNTTPENTVLLDRAPLGTEADYVGTALEAIAHLKPAFRVAALSREARPVGTVVVVRNDLSFSPEYGPRLDSFLRNGGSALLFSTGGPAQSAWLSAHGVKPHPLKEGADRWRVRDWTMDHPIVAALSANRVSPLLGWDFRKGWAFPPSAVDPLALWSDEEVAIGEVKIGVGRLLVCGIAPDRRENDWPVHPAFVPFLHQAVTYLLGAREGANARPNLVGQVLELPAPQGEWRSIDGPAVRDAARSVTGTVVPTAPGIHVFTSPSMEPSYYAVNLAPEESDLTGWSDGAPWVYLAASELSAVPQKIAGPPLAALEAEQRAPLWWSIFAVALVLLIAEVGLANRTMR